MSLLDKIIIIDYHFTVQPKNCADIKKIRKGKVLGAGVSPGSKRTFSCNKKWTLSGLQELTCLNDGQWSGSQPTCVPEGEKVKIHFHSAVLLLHILHLTCLLILDNI